LYQNKRRSSPTSLTRPTGEVLSISLFLSGALQQRGKKDLISLGF
jgi:hypothetical protein